LTFIYENIKRQLPIASKTFELSLHNTSVKLTRSVKDRYLSASTAFNLLLSVFVISKKRKDSNNTELILQQANEMFSVAVMAGRIMSLKNANDTIGNRTRNLPACSVVRQKENT
jgi:hypothetical protein